MPSSRPQDAVSITDIEDEASEGCSRQRTESLYPDKSVEVITLARKQLRKEAAVQRRQFLLLKVSPLNLKHVIVGSQ